MMPGVVAGFTRKFPSGPATVTMVYLAGSGEYVFAPSYGFGAVDPVGFSVVAGAAHVPGATGELLYLDSNKESSSQKWTVYLEARGRIETVPFSAIKIGSVVIPAAAYTIAGGQWPDYTMFAFNLSYGLNSPPFVAGQNIVEFI